MSDNFEEKRKCFFCSKEHTPEYVKTMRFRRDHNIWDNISVVNKALAMTKDFQWSWARNTTCKYLNIRVDMRDGGAIISDSSGKRISPKQLLWQYSKETPNRPKDDEAYNSEYE